MKISIVVGNPKAESRTLEIARLLADRISARIGSGGDDVEVSTVDLALIAGDLFDWSNEAVQGLNTAVAESDLAIVATPTYKGSYTGLLKAFLDRYPTDGLNAVVAVPVMTGGSDLHGLAGEVHLRPLLVELGAVVPTRSLFFVMSRYTELEIVVEEWLDRNWPALARQLAVETVVGA